MRNVYLDNNATTQVAPEVIEAMRPFFEELWGNPSSMHTFGGQVRKYVESAREQVASLIGAQPHEIMFTSCGSESDNTAIRGVLEAANVTRPHVVTTRAEHPAVLSTCRYLRDRGCRLTELDVDARGRLDLDQLREALDNETVLVSVMWGNNETGAVFPVDQIAEIVTEAGCLFHTDAVQAVGKLPVDVVRTPVDILSLSGHKLHAPKGIGALYIRNGTNIAPLIHGGHQEDSRRAGTENVPYIVALGKACELAPRHIEEETTRVAELRDRLEEGILRSCPGAQVNGDTENRLPNTLNVSFEHIEGEAILLLLDRVGIAASSGSACTSGSLQPSHVLRAMGVPFTRVHGSVRFSLSRYTTEGEIEYVLEHLPGIVERLQELSPFATRPAGSSS